MKERPKLLIKDPKIGPCVPRQAGHRLTEMVAWMTRDDIIQIKVDNSSIGIIGLNQKARAHQGINFNMANRSLKQ